VKLSLPAILPHRGGSFSIPVKDFPKQWALVQFFDKRGQLLDEEKISWATMIKSSATTTTKSGAWTISEAAGKFRLSSGKIGVVVNKTTGLIESAAVNGRDLLSGSPVLVVNYPVQANAFKDTKGVFSGPFVAEQATVDTSDLHLVRIITRGKVDKYPVTLRYELAPSGKITIQYEADSIPPYTWDIGIEAPVAASLDQLSWDRKGYWSTYPVDHMSALQGKTKRNNHLKESYRVRPSYPVAQSMTDYYLRHSIDPGKAALPAAEGYRAKKENILSYIVSEQGRAGAIRVVSDGNQAAKMNIAADGKQSLLVSDKWDYWSLAWGNYQGKRNPSRKVQGTVQLIIE
jgi:hypothetical protein